MQQETSVMKNFAWCAARTPYRSAPEDTLPHSKTLPPSGLGMIPKPGEEGLDKVSYAHILHHPHALYAMD